MINKLRQLFFDITGYHCKHINLSCQKQPSVILGLRDDSANSVHHFYNQVISM